MPGILTAAQQWRKHVIFISDSFLEVTEILPEIAAAMAIQKSRTDLKLCRLIVKQYKIEVDNV
jgi:hypothetical protein